MSGKKEEVTEVVLPSGNSLKNVLYIKLTEQVFKRVYKIAKDNDSNMSEVARLCIESKLIDIEKLLKEIKELKRGIGTE